MVAVQAVAAAADSATAGPGQSLAGGTTLIDLMKLDVMRPDTSSTSIALADRRWSRSSSSGDGLRLGALARMSDVAEHPDVRRDYPVIAQSLELAASPQLRNMATLAAMCCSARAAPISATSL